MAAAVLPGLCSFNRGSKGHACVFVLCFVGVYASVYVCRVSN